MNEKVNTSLPPPDDWARSLTSDVFFLCSGSADCILRKSPERPLRRHAACVTRAQSSGECFYTVLVRQNPLSDQTNCLHVENSFSFIWCQRITPLSFPPTVSQTKCAALPPGSAVSMLRALFQDVHVQVGAECFRKYLTTERGSWK